MQLIRNRARLIAAIALSGNLIAAGLVSMALSCDPNAAPPSEHAGMENCPLHARAQECSVHGDQHGTHECDCPTIGCSQSDTGFLTLFGAVGVLPDASDIAAPVDAGDAAPVAASSAIRLVPPPVSPPPRT